MNTEDDNAMNMVSGDDRDVDRVGRLLSAYVAEHKSEGAADPTPYLAKVEGLDREELIALIDAYLVRSPGRPWDPDAMAGSFAATIKQKFNDLADGGSGMWPSLLPDLRNAAHLPRSVVIDQLSEAIGAADKKEKVGRYYNEMEHGRLAASGVSDRVLAALAKIFGSSVAELRAAGSDAALGPHDAAVVFARRVSSSDSPEGVASPGDPDLGTRNTGAAEDEVDRLFTGGP